MFSVLSSRRLYLDFLLQKHLQFSTGLLLDLGGKRLRRRGFFDPSSLNCEVTIINPQLEALPDYVGYLSDYNIPDSYFDNILCTEVLEYSSSPSALIHQMKRVLKPGGHIFLSVPFLHRMHGDSQYDYYRFTPSSLEYLFSDFHDLKILPMGGFLSVVSDFLIGSTRVPPLLRIFLSQIMRLFIRHERQSLSLTTGFFVIACL